MACTLFVAAACDSSTSTSDDATTTGISSGSSTTSLVVPGSSEQVTSVGAARQRWSDVGPESYVLTLTIIPGGPGYRIRCVYRVQNGVAVSVEGPIRLDTADGADPDGWMKCDRQTDGTVEAQLDRLEAAVALDTQDDPFPRRISFDERGVPTRHVEPGDTETDGGTVRLIEVSA